MSTAQLTYAPTTTNHLMLTIEPSRLNRGFYGVNLFDGKRIQYRQIGSDQSDLSELLWAWRLDQSDVSGIYARICQHFLKSDRAISFKMRNESDVAWFSTDLTWFSVQA